MANLNIPLIIMKDFNAITSPLEYKGGPFYYYAHKALMFSNFISTNSLLDIGYIGNIFSWCNDQVGLATW